MTGRRDSVSFSVLILLFGACLRFPYGAVPAVMGPIASDFDLSAQSQGLVSSLAIASMAAAAPLGAMVGTRLGPKRATTLALTAVATAQLARWATPTYGYLMATTVVAGLGMGMGATIAPELIRRHVTPSRAPFAAGMFVAGSALGVAVSAIASPAVATATGSWHFALATWGLVTIAVLAAWATLMPTSAGRQLAPPSTRPRPPSHMRSGAAWRITLYAATPMVVGFTAVAWLIPIFRDAGGSTRMAAVHLVVFQATQLVTMLLLPITIRRRGITRAVLLVPMVGSAAALIALLAQPKILGLPAVAALGLGVGGATVLGLALVAQHATDSASTVRLGSMVMMVSFALSTIGPALLGSLHDASGSYAPGLATLLALLVLAIAIPPDSRRRHLRQERPLDNDGRCDRAGSAAHDA